MYRIAHKKDLNEQVTLMKIEAPLIAKKARPGQFIIFRIDEYGERVPLTIADTDPEAGTVTIIFQKVGLSTNLLGSMNAGDSILDFVGPLGAATDLDGIKKAAVIGGGVGCAIAYPTAKALYQAGAEVDMIAGFRSEDLVIIREEMEAASSRFFLCTDDGSAGRKGFVTDQLRELLEQGEQYDAVFAIGPGADDEVCIPPHQGMGRAHHCQPQSHYDRWHWYVRRLSGHSGRSGEVCLCGWPRFRRF